MGILKTIATALGIEDLTAAAVQDNPIQVLEAVTENEVAINATLTALQSDLEAEKLNAENLTAQLVAANSELATVTASLNAKDLELSEAQKSVSELSEAIKNANSEKATLTAQLQTLNNEATELKGKINAIAVPKTEQVVKEDRTLIIPKRRANKQ